MHALSQGRVKYVSGFKTQGGNIEISVEKGDYNTGTDYNKGFVMIRYNDIQNYNIKRQSDLDDI